MSKPTVLLVGKGPPDSGGISAMISTLESHLTSSFDVELLNLTRPNDYEAGVMSVSNVLRTLTDTINVFRASRRHDVVYLHSAFVPAVTMIRAALLLIAGRLAGAQTVVHVHGGSLPEWATSRPRIGFTRLAAATAHRVISVSDGITETLGRQRTSTIPNGVDTSMFVPGRREPGAVPTIVYIGLLTRRKGVVDLIHASQLLDARGVEHRLKIVGGRPDEGGEEEALVRAASTGREEFTGAIPHEAVPAVLAGADIFCLPSWWEAMPLSILEAMACGLPIVATSVGQVPQIVDSAFGCLVPPQQTESLADALEALLTDNGLRDRMGRHARHQAESQYSLSRTVEEISGVLHSVVER